MKKNGLLLKIILFFSMLPIFLLLSASSYADWSAVTPPSVNLAWWTLTSVSFPTATEGWAVGTGRDATNFRGVLFHYSSGTWNNVTPPSVSTNWTLTSVSFPTAAEGWAVGRDYINNRGVLLHYSSGTWNNVTPPYVNTNWTLTSVSFPTAAEGWAVGWDEANNRGVLLHYSLGVWNDVTRPSLSTGCQLYGVSFSTAAEGWAVGWDLINDRGALLHYSSGAWDKITPPHVSTPGGSFWGLSIVSFPSAAEGWAVGENSYAGGVLLHYTGNAQVATSVPTLTEWGIIIFTALLGICSIYFLRKRRISET